MSCHTRKRKNSSWLVQQLPLESRDYITGLFKKKFTYKKAEQPSVVESELQPNDNSSAFHIQKDTNAVDSDGSNSTDLPNVIKLPNICSSKWTINKFMDMKDELNTLKTNLNDKDMIDWHVHTRRVNLAGNIAPEIRRHYRSELCTQAWCKFYEIASTYLNIKPGAPYFSVHLCEAPGAFVTSLNHYLLTLGYRSEWNWLATTLNPYYEGNNIGEMIDDDGFIRHTRDNWCFGADGTGNLMSLANLHSLTQMVNGARVDLVTADGSVDCQGVPAEQEDVVSRLQHCEAITAINILAPGGNLVIKMFTLFEAKSICLVYLLYRLFDQVHMFKPCTSKGGNSEVYVVCLGYCGVDKCRPYVDQLTHMYFGDTEPDGCLFQQSDIPATFLQQHYTCARFFKDCQMTSIQRNLDLHKVVSEVEATRLDMEQDYCMECFFARYNLTPMVYETRIMKTAKRRSARRGDRMAPRPGTRPPKEDFADRARKEGKFCGSFQERVDLSTLPWHQKVQQIETYDDLVDNEDNSLWIQKADGVAPDSDEIDGWRCLCGRPLTSIQSSRFCYGQLIFQTHELIQNVQWILEGQQIDVTTVAAIVDTLIGVLHTAITQDSRQTHTYRSADTPDSAVGAQKTQTASPAEPLVTDISASHQSCDKEHTVHESQSGMRKEEFPDGQMVCDTPGCQASDQHGAKSTFVTTDIRRTGSSIFEALHNKLSVSSEPPDGAICCVRLYSVSTRCVDAKFELSDVGRVLDAVLDIVQTCPVGGSVVLELGASLSRLSAGLTYLLYCCFTEIGFVHHHGNLLQRHLVCVSCRQCPIRLQQYIKAAHKQFLASRDEGLLEIVPIQVILEDTEFVRFLQISNCHLLQSFITTVIHAERQRHTANQQAGHVTMATDRPAVVDGENG